MKPSQTLRAARALIEKPENWCKGNFAVDSGGRPVSQDDIRACKFCSVGALEKIGGVCIVTIRYLEGIMGMEADVYNDTHTHAEVLAKFDEAIALAESEGN